MAPGSKDEGPKAFEVGHDDKIAGYYTPAHDQRRNWGSSSEEAALELAAQKPRQQTMIADLPRPQRVPASPGRKLLPLAVIAAVLALPFLALWGYRAWEARSRPTHASGLIVIDSVPSNARLFIDGREVGRTPYVAPNTFAPGSTIPARVVYPGAQEWTGAFPGGVDTSFTAELQAKPE